MKTCFKCGDEKPITEFYKHPRMADGHLNKCKICTKKDASAHRANNLEEVQAYDRRRGSLPHRVVAREEYAKTDAYKESHAKSLKKYHEKHPKRNYARNAVSNALRDGKLKQLPCWVCGKEEVEGHHPDYDAPLDVVWLCKKHHMETHELARVLFREGGC